MTFLIFLMRNLKSLKISVKGFHPELSKHFNKLRKNRKYGKFLVFTHKINEIGFLKKNLKEFINSSNFIILIHFTLS